MKMNLRIRRKKEKKFLVSLCRFLVSFSSNNRQNSLLLLEERRKFLQKILRKKVLPFDGILINTYAELVLVTDFHTVDANIPVIFDNRRLRKQAKLQGKPWITLSYLSVAE
jgi:hypothetical protein